tara:strand:- start:4194 stop:4391 length:198 start_codon:yes stop_codon:yes gene_type:complete
MNLFDSLHDFLEDDSDKNKVNDLYEDMEKLNTLYEELMWPPDVPLKMRADFKNNRIIIELDEKTT